MRRLAILAVIFVCLLLVPSTVLAQDAHPQPMGSTFVFMPLVQSNDGPQIRPAAQFVPGWIRYQGPCLSDGTCPGDYRAFQSDKRSAMESFGSFKEVSSYATFNEGKVGSPSFLYKCFVEDCLPFLKDPSEVQSSEVVGAEPEMIAADQTKYFINQVLPPPDIPPDIFERIDTWLHGRKLNYDIVAPGTMPVSRAIAQGMNIFCEPGSTPKLAFGDYVQNVYFKIGGVLDCWSTTQGGWRKAVILVWVGVNNQLDPRVDAAFAASMTTQGLVLLDLADFRNQWYSYKYADSRVGSLVWQDIQNTEPQQFWLDVPDFGQVAIFGGIASETAKIGVWLGRAGEFAGAAFSGPFLGFVIPPGSLCPMFDLSPSDNVPPQTVCGAWGDSVGIPQ